ncbi:hypothetical protein HQ590_08325, partial [bacterium]|nr:hypothetical protein [bacterium]
MNWKAMMRRSVLGKGAEKLVEDFLRREIPPFVAPTNPRAWTREVRRLRREALQKVYLRGYPPAVVRAKPRVVWTGVLRPEPGYRIRKLRYEIYPDYWIPALLYEPRRLTGKVPVVLNPHGHHAGGLAHVDYQIRCANIALRGALALSIEFIGMGQLQADHWHNQQAHLNLTGLAGVGLFYL